MSDGCRDTSVQRGSPLYWFGFAAVITAIVGPLEWYHWASLAIIAPILDWLGDKLAHAIGADRLGIRLRDWIRSKLSERAS